MSTRGGPGQRCQALCTRLEGLVAVDDTARRLGARLAWSLSWGPPVGGLDPGALREEAERLLDELQGSLRLEDLPSHPLVRAYRDFYWRIGIDPTKTRPASEALVRRGLRRRWPSINPVVDAGNIASARTMVPIGLYDADRFTPPATLRLSRGGEEFHPIGGGAEQLPPGVPILADAEGRVLHLFPHRDSRDTMVTRSTSCVLVVAAGVPGVPAERLADAVRETQRLHRRLGWTTCPRLASSP